MAEEWEQNDNNSRLKPNFDREQITRLAYTFAVFLISSIGLFIIFGDTWSFAAGYIHAVLYNHQKKMKDYIYEMEQE